MTTTINSASTGAERFIELTSYGAHEENLVLAAEIPSHKVFFHIAVNKAELAAAVAKETGSVLIEPKKVNLAPWEFSLLSGISITVDEDTAASSLRQAAAHFLALAAEKEAEEAAQKAKISKVALFLNTKGIPGVQADEIAKGLIEAGLIAEEEEDA